MMYDGSVEYGGSVEYDVSLKFDVVVVCTKRTKDKEKHYLKISARESHIVPLYNRLVLTTHGLTEISDLVNLNVVLQISQNHNTTPSPFYRLVPSRQIIVWHHV